LTEALRFPGPLAGIYGSYFQGEAREEKRRKRGKKRKRGMKMRAGRERVAYRLPVHISVYLAESRCHWCANF